MNSAQVFWIAGLLVPSLLFLCLGVGFASALFRKKRGRRFDIRNEFPFELAEGANPSLRISRICFILWGVLDASLSFYLLWSIERHSFLLSMSVIFAIFMVARNVAIVALFYIPAYRFKPHFFAFVGSGALTGFGAAISVIICANFHAFAGEAVIPFAIFIGLLGAGAMLVLANPKLANWAKLESSVDESGAIVEKRPKYFVLAFSEWLVLFLAIVSSALSLIAVMVFDLI